MLNNIKLLLGITSNEKDELLTLLISQATDEAMNYTHRKDLDEDLANTIIRMVVYNYNRLGTEGVDGETYSGVNFDYSADYPENILRSLRAKRKVVVI